MQKVSCIYGKQKTNIFYSQTKKELVMKKLTILLSMGLMFVLTFSINATTYTSTATGNWSAMLWSPVGTPGVSDDVVIADGHTVTIDQNVSIANLTVGGGTSGILTFDA